MRQTRQRTEQARQEHHRIFTDPVRVKCTNCVGSHVWKAASDATESIFYSNLLPKDGGWVNPAGPDTSDGSESPAARGAAPGGCLSDTPRETGKTNAGCHAAVIGEEKRFEGSSSEKEKSEGSLLLLSFSLGRCPVEAASPASVGLSCGDLWGFSLCNLGILSSCLARGAVEMLNCVEIRRVITRRGVSFSWVQHWEWGCARFRVGPRRDKSTRTRTDVPADRSLQPSQ